jgi:uncharacterized membrane protein YccC
VIQRIVRDAFRFERNAVDPVFAFRSSIGFTVAILAGFASGVPIYAVSAALGAMMTGFGSRQGNYRSRAQTMLAMTAAMSGALAAGLLASHSPEFAVLALALWSIGYGAIVPLGPAAVSIGANSLTTLIVFENFPQPLPLAIGCVIAMAAGGLLQTLLLVVFWPIQRYPQERKALAAAYRELASYAASMHEAARVPASATLSNVRKTLADPQPLGRAAAATAFQTLLDEAERIRASLALLAMSGDERFAPARTTIAAALNEIAHALEDAHAPDDDDLRQQLQTQSDDATLRALYGQLRAARRAAGVPLRGFALPREFPHPIRIPRFHEELEIIRSNLHGDSAFARHTVRLVVVVVAASVVGHLLPLQKGYWVTLTAALVLRPDFTTTFSRGVARIVGTSIGAVIATAIVLAVPGTPHVYLALAIVFAVVGYVVFPVNYALYSFTVTGYIVFLLALLGTPESAAVENRFYATLAGGLLAMISYAIWPTWEAPHMRSRLRELCAIDLTYAQAMLAGLADPGKRDMAKMRAQRAKIWKARAAANESLERALSEPQETHEMDDAIALGIMASTQRVGLANTALSSLFQDPATPAFAALAPLAGALERVTLDRAEGLRDAYALVAAALAHDDSSAVKALLSSCDLLVDSLNTMVELWEREGYAALRSA